VADPLGKIIRSAAGGPGRLLAKAKITPNQVTVLGFLVNCLVAYFIAKEVFPYLVLGILIWAAGFFDALDGSVARITGKTTVFGNFFDSVLDRYSDSVIYFGMVVHFLRAGENTLVILVVIAAIGSMAVSYTRAKAESLGAKCEVGLMPRTPRIIIIGAGFCLGQVFWAVLAVAVLSHVTVAQRVYRVYRAL
jgi:CDP-diacylglycerol---glycerol-3-phosphate 3-phosphatidyltransferase